MAPVLVYWNTRGLVDPIRFLLAYSDVEYEFKPLEFGPPPEYSKDIFRSTKHELGLDFPNLPYYIDGDLKLSQTLAILRHLARKNDLVGSTEEEITRADMAEQAAVDIEYTSFRAWYTHDEAAKNDLTENLPKKLAEFDKFLGAGPFILGEKLSYPDFILYTVCDYSRTYNPSFLDNLESLKNFIAKFESLPKIDAFIKSDKFKRWPITGPYCGWGFNTNETSETESAPEAPPANPE